MRRVMLSKNYSFRTGYNVLSKSPYSLHFLKVNFEGFLDTHEINKLSEFMKVGIYARVST